MSHIKVNCTKFDSWRLPVCLFFVCLCLRLSLALRRKAREVFTGRRCCMVGLLQSSKKKSLIYVREIRETSEEMQVYFGISILF